MERDRLARPCLGWLLCGLVFGSGALLRGQETSEPDPPVEVSTLIEHLQQGDLQQRRDAAWALAERGPDAAAAVTALTQAVGDRDPQVANGSLQALGRIGKPAESAVPSLFEQLRSGDEQRRYRAAYALGRTVSPNHPRIKEELDHRVATVRAAVVMAIGWMDPPPTPLIGEVAVRLGDDSEEVVAAATDTLLKLGPHAVPALTDLVRRPDPPIQRRAAETLALIGPSAAAAHASLMELSRSETAASRAAAILALGKTAKDREDVRQRILEALEDADEQVVSAAITSVIQLGSTAGQAVPRLVSALDEGPQIANLAAVALGRLGSAALPAVPEMLRKLTADNRTTIVTTVSSLGPDAVPTVIEAARAGTVAVEQAAEIVRGMGPRAVVVIQPLLNSETPTDRAVAARALGALSRNAETANSLTQLLADQRVEVRLAAADGLAQLGPVAPTAVDALQTGLKDEDPSVRGQCLRALVMIRQGDESIVPAVLVGLRDADALVRRQAADVLKRFDPLPDPSIPALCDALADPDATVRRVAAETLGGNAQAVTDHADVLVRSLGDTEPAVALAAATALKQARELDADAVSALTQLLDQASPAMRRAAIAALAAGGEHAQGIVEQLQVFCDDSSPEIRLAALQTLAQLADNDKQRVERLVRGLDDEDWTVRREVTNTIGELGDRAKQAVPRLLLMISHPQDSDAVTGALRRIDAAPPEAIPILLEILQDPDSGRREMYYALHLLRKVGPEAREALPVLRDLRDRADGRQREFLERAIREIEE